MTWSTLRMSGAVLVASAAMSFLGGCATNSRSVNREVRVVSALDDPVGNLEGEKSRSFLDIVHAEVALNNDTYTFSVEVASPLPKQADMVDKRIDFIWFVDIDRNRSTGQSSSGNDYNIHLWLNGEDGWRSSWYKVSPVSQKDGVETADRDFTITVKDRTAELSFPKSYLPSNAFDWLVNSGTQNAPKWPPMTRNPDTARRTLIVPQ